jgi:antitoxin ParD1/3/4
MNVDLTPELEELVQSKVQSGRYQSASEVVSEALRLLDRQDAAQTMQLKELQNRMDRALGESVRGEGVDGEAFLKKMLDDLDAEEIRQAG